MSICYFIVIISRKTPVKSSATKELQPIACTVGHTPTLGVSWVSYQLGRGRRAVKHLGWDHGFKIIPV